jgi:hypothetical protein
MVRFPPSWFEPAQAMREAAVTAAGLVSAPMKGPSEIRKPAAMTGATDALTARFEPGEGLKTGGGCGEGGAVFIGADREARSFPVELAAAERCR